jgi:hypothetical protein
MAHGAIGGVILPREVRAARRMRAIFLRPVLPLPLPDAIPLAVAPMPPHRVLAAVTPAADAGCSRVLQANANGWLTRAD